MNGIWFTSGSYYETCTPSILLYEEETNVHVTSPEWEKEKMTLGFFLWVIAQHIYIYGYYLVPISNSNIEKPYTLENFWHIN